MFSILKQIQKSIFYIPGELTVLFLFTGTICPDWLAPRPDWLALRDGAMELCAECPPDALWYESWMSWNVSIRHGIILWKCLKQLKSHSCHAIKSDSESYLTVKYFHLSLNNHKQIRHHITQLHKLNL
jgi:hypothetical protein